MTTHAIDEPVSESAPKYRRIQTLLILGASGDLTGRLLLPGLARLIRHGRARDITLVGAGSDDWSPDQWQDRLHTSFADAPSSSSINDHDGARQRPSPADGESAVESIRSASTYHQLDVTALGTLAALLAQLEGPVAIYFALPPAVSEKACSVLKPGDLPEGSRLVMEKPFGTDRASAHHLNSVLSRLVPEDHVHRVDHFLGKATVLNILGLRFANRLLEPVWNNLHIESVDIIFDEDLALENRARYYDNAGALKDMIQSHLLQVMALIAMNAPSTLHERDLRDHIGTVLRASSVDQDFRSSTRRARYTAGSIDGRQVPDYVAEAGVEPTRNTETLAEIVVSISNERWAGVPFRLRSGKALGKKRKEAVINFKPVNHLPLGFTGQDAPTRLRIGFGPDTLKLDLDVNGPGDVFCLDRTTLEAELNASDLLPYGEVLDGVLTGDPTLSVRGDTAEDCWRIVEPVLAAWQADEVPMDEYPAGSDGCDSWEPI
ncbi:glucose-6-phosphate dehydrogenase [Arthrobacter sp. H5]|uniref:glucose-6-phosphate dehydrogenase n=1 Tax=Arthrobacter sp. H5 TaxID=1267973 RepID=UPI000489414F|nr:glucose-6-phosphate dehydrogenase [Arthrobacter sp. H5]